MVSRREPQMKNNAFLDVKERIGTDFKKLSAPLKRKIRSIKRLLSRELPSEVRELKTQELAILRYEEEAQKQTEAKLQRSMNERYKQVKFVERRKIERRIRRAEKELKSAADDEAKKQALERLAELKDDLEYVLCFPKTQKYISLYKDNNDALAEVRRQKIRETIKSNLAAAAAAREDMEGTIGADEDIHDSSQYSSDDEFFESRDEDDNKPGTGEEVKVRAFGVMKRRSQKEVSRQDSQEIGIRSEEVEGAAQESSEDDFFTNDRDADTSKEETQRDLESPIVKETKKLELNKYTKAAEGTDDVSVPKTEKRKRKRKRPKKHK